MNVLSAGASTRLWLLGGCALCATGKTLVARVNRADLGGLKMSKPTNDEMHEILTMFYGPNKTLGDMLKTYFADTDPVYRATLQYQWYDDTEAEGFTVGDIANDYWSEVEYLFSNIEWEDGTNCLMETDEYMALEAGN